MEVAAINEALQEHVRGTHSHALHCYCPRETPSAGVVSCTHNHWLRPLASVGDTGSCLYKHVSGRRMQRLSQFRLGPHNICLVWLVDFSGPDMFVRTDQVCTHCGGIAVADELHMIHEGPVLQPLRLQY